MGKPDTNDLEHFNHVDLLFPSRYVKASDLKGRDVTVTIASITPREELAMNKNGKVITDKKPVVYFTGAEKGLVLNKTNGQTIAKLYGPETLGWIGKAVILFPTTVKAKGEVVEAIRIRPYTPDNAPASGGNQ